MYTWSWMLALHLLGTMPASPNWHRDYGFALRRAEAAKKPIAVFIASGTDGWKAASEEGELSPTVRRLLADHYICVYIDARQPDAQSLVRSFEAGQLPLVVLSTQDRVHQAYRHSGKLANEGLAQTLQRHAFEDTADLERPEVGLVWDPSSYPVYETVSCGT